MQYFILLVLDRRVEIDRLTHGGAQERQVAERLTKLAASIWPMAADRRRS
jgi:hypothetical protein